jgi:putative RNA 2'-phosphotransferase
MEKLKVKLSKFISLILRHNPQKIGVKMDAEGWVNVDELLAGLKKQGAPIDMPMLKDIVESNNKKRFVFSEDGTRIRANQGHTLPVTLNYKPAMPPPVLYHGTAARFVQQIIEEGLHKGKRFYVHMAADPETAKVAARRWGSPLLLKIAALEMHTQGFEFYSPTEGLWLTNEVPARFISRL